MFFSIEATILGCIVKVREEGRDPIPWLSFRVETYGMVWTSIGKMDPVRIMQDVVLQGSRTIAEFKSKLVPGAEVFAKGQLLPFYCVASDSKDRTPRVILASTIQINERKEE